MPLAKGQGRYGRRIFFGGSRGLWTCPHRGKKDGDASRQLFFGGDHGHAHSNRVGILWQLDLLLGEAVDMPLYSKMIEMIRHKNLLGGKVFWNTPCRTK